MEHYATILRDIVERIGLPPLKEVAARPGVNAAYRITLHYFDFRASDCVVTLKTMRPADTISEAVYAGHFNHKPITRTVSVIDYENFSRVIQTINFDKLPDQQNVPMYSVDLCMVERASGSFTHGIIFAPQKADGVYHTLLTALTTYLPEVFREVK